MKTIHAITIAAGLAAGAAAVPATAHHSAAMFDDEINLVLEGTVTRFDYLNPHSWLYVDVVNEDGTTTEWGFELAAPPRLRRIGISPNFWEPGDEVTVMTHPLRDGRPAGDLAASISADGSEFGNAEELRAEMAAAE